MTDPRFYDSRGPLALGDLAKAIGATICPVKFERFERGEGIEKRHDNLADEIAQMQNM